jgi:hypothetical protein
LTSYIFRKYVLGAFLGFTTSAFGSLPVTGVADAAQCSV